MSKKKTQRHGDSRSSTAPAMYLALVGKNNSVPTADELGDLIRQIASSSDRRAFASLFCFYAPRLKSFLGRQGFGANECEDIVQETMLNVWRKAATFDPGRARASTWIYTIARNLGIDRRRQDSRGKSWLELTSFDEVDPDPLAEARLIAVESETRIREAMKALPEEQAAVIRMTFYGENSQADIAKRLGIPLGTVKSRARLAIIRLRKAMGAGYDVSAPDQRATAAAPCCRRVAIGTRSGGL